MSYFDSCEFNLDWLNGVLELDDAQEFFDFLGSINAELGMKNWFLAASGKYNYNTRFCFQGKNSIQAMWNCSEAPITRINNEHNNSGLFLTLSGDGIRQLNEYCALQKLFGFFRTHNFRASRVDVNMDVFDPDNPLVPLIIEAFRFSLLRENGKPTLCTDFRRSKSDNFLVYENYDTFHNRVSHSCQLGNHSSRLGMFRCYDKWLELKSGRLAGVIGDATLAAKGCPDYWYRLEYELHKENAAACFTAFLNGVCTCESLFAYCADKFFRVVVPLTTASDISHSASDEVWDEFLVYLNGHLAELDEVIVHQPYIKATLASTLHFVEHMMSWLVCVDELRKLYPDWFSERMYKGKKRFYESAHYSQLRSEMGIINNDGEVIII